MPSASSPYEAVAQLLARYAELIDDGDFAAVGAHLHPARIVLDDGTVIAEGAAAIEALYTSTTRRHGDGTPRTQHVITNLIVEPLPEAAGRARVEARSVFTVFQAVTDGELRPIVAGRYRDIVEQDGDGTWRFAERCMMPRLWGDVSEHLTF